MKRKTLMISALLIALFMLFTVANTVMAADVTMENAEAKIGNQPYATLKEAVTNATDGQTITVLKDVTVSEGYIGHLTPSKKITIDFAGKTLKFTGSANCGFYIYGPITLKNGTITSDVQSPNKNNPSSNQASTTLLLASSANVDLVNMVVNADEGNSITCYQNSTKVTIEADSTVKNNGVGAIIATTGNHTIDVKGKIQQTDGIDGRDMSAIYSSYQNKSGRVDINVYDGASITAGRGGGILQMCPGNINVTGGTISGSTGIAMTDGNINVTGGTISGTGNYKEYVGTGEFQVHDNGAAVYIEPTAEMEATISGGELNSKNSAAISAPATDGKNDNLNISIEDGTFNGSKEHGSIEVEDKDEFISGGQYNIAPDMADIGDSLAVSKEGDDTYYVGQNAEDVIKNAQNGDTVYIENGEVSLEGIHNGVKIQNNGNGVVVLNGQKIENGDTVVIENPDEIANEQGTETTDSELDDEPKTGDMSTGVIGLIALAILGGIIVSKKLAK